ncbi:MAG: site-specific integrase, partial [Actinomycetota bacterium]|nr:site-specific integrase [Actinomycetota bacterium]
MSTEELGLAPAAEAFLRAGRAERDLSPHTLDAYRSDLSQFVTWAERRGVSSVSQVERKALRHFVGYLGTLGYSRRSMARKLSAVRSFFRWAVTHDLI